MPKLTTLELEITQSTKASTAKIDALADSLRRLYDASKGSSGSAKELKEEADAIKSFPKVTEAATRSVVNVAKALAEVADAATNVSPESADNLRAVGDAVAHVVANVKGGAEASKEMTKLAAALKAMNESTISLSGDAGDKIMGISLAIQQLAQSVTGADPDSADWLKNQTQSLAKLSASMAGLAGGGQTLSSIASGFRDLNAAMNMQWPDNVHISDLMSEEVKYLGMYANSLAKISNASNGLKEVPQNIIALSEALKTLMMAVSGSGAAASIFDAQARSIGYASRAITALTKDSDKVAALPGVFEKLAERVQTLFAAMQGQEQNVAVFTVLSKAIAQLARAGVQLTDVSAALKGYNNAVARAEQEIRGAVIAGTQIEVVEHKTRETTKAFSGLNLQIGRTMAKMGGAFGKVLFAPMTAVGRSVSALTGRFGKLFHSIKRIAMYRGIRTFIKAITSGIKSGIDHLYEWSAITDGVFKKSMDSLAESAHYVRDSLGAMIAPLVNALAPAVEYLADKFVELLNAINQTFAYFTGQDSWTKATRQATEYKDVTDDAAGAQKKLNKQLAAFDELNNLTTNDPSSRGKGNKDDDIDANHFLTEKVDVPQWIADIKAAIQNSEFYEAGSIFGGHLNDMVREWNAYADGLTIGTKITNVLKALNGFLETFSFYDLGKKVARWIDGIVTSVDEDALSDFFGNLVGGALDALNGFIQNLEVMDIAGAFAMTINKVFSEENVKKLTTGLGTLFNQFFNFLKYTIEGGDYTYIDDAGKQITKHFKGIDFSGIGRAVGEGIANFFKTVDWETVGTVVADVATGIYNFIKSAARSLVDNDGAVLNAIGSFFSGLWGEDGEGLSNIIKIGGLVAAWKLVIAKVFGVGGKGGDAGLLGYARTAIGDFFSQANSGLVNSSGGGILSWSAIITVSVEAAKETSEWISSMKEYGFAEGTLEYFGVQNRNSVFINVAPRISDASKAIFDSLPKEEQDIIINLKTTADERSLKALDFFMTNGTSVASELSSAASAIKDAFSSDPENMPFFKRVLEIIDTIKKALGIEDKSNAVPASHKPSTMPTAPIDDDPSGFTQAGGWLGKGFQKALDASKTLNTELDKAKTPRTVTVTDKNGGLKAGATNAVKMAGKSGLGGLKSSYGTTVKATNLSTYEGKATSFRGALAGVKPSYSTKINATNLVASATDASTLVGTKGLGGLKNKYSTTFTGANLATGAKDASSVKTNLNAINGKTYKATVKVDTENYNNTKKKIDSLNTISEHTVRFKPIIDKSTTGSLISGSGNTANFTLKLDALAQGGFPQGDIFVANERGPELIGTINGRNAVASNGEITGITDAVYETGEDEAALLREQNQLLRQLLAKDNRVMLAPNAAAGRWVNQAQRAYNLATGGV